jgi:hypothetical protein
MSALAGCLLVVLIAALGLTLLAGAGSGGRRDGDAGEDEGGGGGSVRRTPLGRPPEPPGAEPDWWPAFERDFAAYARERTGAG